MEDKNFKTGTTSPRILVAPLDWGLGHATRCIPIIKELIQLNCTVLIAGDHSIYSLLKKEFPTTVFLRFKGYEIKYSRHKKYLILKIFLQLPKILSSIWRENKWIKKMVKEDAIDAIISDNRLGMFSKKIPSIYITHQLFIKTGNIFTENIAQRIHYHYIKKYKECWVPDYKEDGLAGVLSHPKRIPENVDYIGPLSRLTPLQNIEPIYDLLVLLSGPEPQRTIFENQVLAQLKKISGSIFLARGLPIEKDNLNLNSKSIKVVNHVGGEGLNKIISQSKLVVARCGYTTVMDLAAMKKPAILIPTPGQTEQEYLAEYLLKKKFFLTAPQEEFFLSDLLKKSAAFKYESVDFSFNEYKKAIGQFVLSLKKSNFASQ